MQEVSAVRLNGKQVPFPCGVPDPKRVAGKQQVVQRVALVICEISVELHGDDYAVL